MDEPVWSISAVNDAVRDLLESAMNPFWLTGEIGTINIHRSGHVYLILKDEKCQIKATWFGGAQMAGNMQLQIGSKVEAFGKLSCYPARGEYQFNIRNVRLAGRGDLLREFELVRKKLEAEGLFAAERKKPLPRFPRRVGVITAPDGAAVRDFVRLALEKFPAADIAVYPATMQGANTVKEVCRALEFFNRHNNGVDVVVITRGGGSMEDLWPFNDEFLARQVADCALPVISAIGHEIDFTICDFAADFRAPTPSAAAGALFDNYAELYEQLWRCNNDLRTFMQRKLENLHYRLNRAAGHYILREPRHLIELRQQQLDEDERRLTVNVNRSLTLQNSKLQMLNGKLTALNPFAVLERGFAMVQNQNGRVINKINDLKIQENVTVSLAGGQFVGQIKDIIVK